MSYMDTTATAAGKTLYAASCTASTSGIDASGLS